MWKAWEGGRIEALSKDLRVVIADDDRIADRLRELTGYFLKNHRWHNSYILKYAACEALNLVNVVAQILFLNRFLEGEFLTYWIDAIRYGGGGGGQDPDGGGVTDPAARIFPTTAKCRFENRGPSGSVQTIDSLCVLSLNVVNGKIFAVLSFWFVALAAVSAVALAYRLATVAVPPLRFLLLKWHSRGTPNYKIFEIVDESNVGTWFLLYQLAKNVDGAVFEELLAGMFDESLRRRSADHREYAHFLN